ncbi:MAG: GTPase HflX [Desulfatibacillaceae bacterium]
MSPEPDRAWPGRETGGELVPYAGTLSMYNTNVAHGAKRYMKKVYGNTNGLKAQQQKQLQNLYKRRVRPEFVATPELARDVGRLSAQIRRQVGLLIDRAGTIRYVIVGDHQGVVIPSLAGFREGGGRLKGLRLFHTHLKGEPLTDDDLADLAFLRLDLIAAMTLNEDGDPGAFHVGHLAPENGGDSRYEILDPIKSAQDLDIGCKGLIRALEDEFAQAVPTREAGNRKVRALLASVTTRGRREAEDSMAELRELCRSNNMEVVDTVIQHRPRIDPRFLLGRGKLRDLSVMALQKGADIVVFDHELNPSQIRSITDQIEIPVVDRSQLILDIFAQRAMTREGKLQVELAQLKYRLPRLVGRNTALSRLAGGIGGRGPGETKLEIDRRRTRERIGDLEKALKQVQKNRKTQRARREQKGLPVISIVGYTNAGKSTLLNTLTQADVFAENRLFATLDPSSRRLRFPRDMEVIVTDTVGFIKDLPKDLVVAFRATLEELEGADVLLHVIDAANPRHEEQIRSVELILEELGLNSIPVVRVLNKKDLLDPKAVANMERNLSAVAISATRRESLDVLVEHLQDTIESEWEPPWQEQTRKPA